MSRTQKQYKWFTFQKKKDWQQRSLKFCTQCGTRCCGYPTSIDGTKSKQKCKGVGIPKRYQKLSMDV